MTSCSDRPSRRRRWISRGFAGALLLLAVGSCTSVLDLGQYANVAEEMCTLLDRCYAKSENVNCLSTLERHLNDADAQVRSAWLSRFTSYDCLDSCSASRRCLDTAPLCGYAIPCTLAAECCGSLAGHAACTNGVCCTTRGSRCTSDADCCNGAGECDPVERTCGGTHCAEADVACKIDDDCCTKICNHGTCSHLTCSKNLFDCAADEECCSQFCDPATKLCGTLPTCGKPEEACAVDTECCLGLSCKIGSGALAGQCSALSCFPGLVDCSDDEQCCSGRCDPLAFFCVPACLKEGTACDGEGECCAGTCTSGFCAGECSMGFCNDSSDCCTGTCVAHACAAPCNPTTAHDPCITGGPLAPKLDNKLCVDAVCGVDKYCCCGAWDDVCVDIALTFPLDCLALCH